MGWAIRQFELRLSIDRIMGCDELDIYICLQLAAHEQAKIEQDK
jgi:hypothetical protein